MRSRSSSTNSSKSNTSLSKDNIPIFVKISGGKTIPLNVRPEHTIDNVLAFLNAASAIPPDVRLLLAGHQLSRSSTVGELNIQPSSTLQLLSSLRGGTVPTDPESILDLTNDMTATLPVSEAKSDPSPQQPSSQPAQQPLSGTVTPTTAGSGTSTPTSTAPRKSNKPRCSKQGCKTAAQPIVGDCGFCQKRFCGKHRMLESHACTGLDDARQADKDRNTAKLEGERTVMLRGL